MVSAVTVIMGGVPLPARADESRALIGRGAELAELASMLGVRPIRIGHGKPPDRAVLLSGDAGVGKTRLLTELRDVAFTEGWQVVAGHCLDFGDSALPYLPFSEILGRLDTDLPQVVEQVALERPALRALQPGRRTISGAEHDDMAAVGRGELFEAVHALFEAVAHLAPLLVVVEDAHWADTSTRDLLSFLFSRTFEGPVEIVSSYRSDDLHRRHPLRRATAEWTRIPGVGRMQLNPLPAGDVRTLVKQLHPEPIRESDLAGIVARAEGNAFFVEELVGATSGNGLPDNLAELLLVRLDRLAEPSQLVVRAASVGGRRVSHALLAEVAGVDGTALEQALREAVELNVLIPTRNDYYRFRHALLAEAVYDDLLPGERVRIHAAYVAALAGGHINGTAAELARHARAARDLVTAVDASIRAGDEAMGVGGPDDAAHHFETALELLSDPGARGDYVVDIGLLGSKAADALIASGRPARAIAVVKELLDNLPEGSPIDWRGRLLGAMANAVMLDETRLDPLQFTTEAMQLVPDAPSPLRARTLAVHARAHAFHSNVDQARRFGSEALAMAETQDLPRLATDVFSTLAALGSRESDDVRVALEEAAQRAAAAGSETAELRSLYLLGRWHQDRADFAEALPAFGRAASRAVEMGQPWAPYGFDARFMQGQVATITGEYDVALGLLDVSGQAPPAIPESLLAALRVVVQAARGDQSALTVLPQLRPHWHKDGLLAITVGPAAIELHAQAADPVALIAEHDDVVETLTMLWREFFHARLRLGAVTIGGLASLVGNLSGGERAGLAETVARIDQGAQRSRVLQREESGYWGPEGLAWAARLPAEELRFRWLSGIDIPDEAALVAAWREALARFETYGHVWEIARTRARLAAVLHAVGEDAEARDLADKARATAEHLGTQPLIDELRVSFGQGRSRSRATQQKADDLTPRETEILALVASGRSNGEIGKQLFIATKTVSVHVSNILAKLGASGRTEAAAIARRRGLLQ
ncbi:MAG: regulatory protein LuxR [Marmoricola sp.]|nr:regulatory protein LuxR [Marmoricola sp.]